MVLICVVELAREGARSRLGPMEEGLWDISDSYKSSFCEKVEGEGTLQPSDEGRKALHRSPENQLWSRLGPCRSR